MKNVFLKILILSTLFIGFQENAKAVDADAENHFSLGVGAYAFSFTNSDDSRADIEFSGYNITAGTDKLTSINTCATPRHRSILILHSYKKG